MSKLCLEKKSNNISFSAGKKEFKKNYDILSETVSKFPKKKNLFEEIILLNDDNVVNTYPKNISPMFLWMQKLNLPKKPKILDIGANIGMFSLSYASIFKGAEIHSFEPVPFIYNYLCKNLEINPHLNHKIYPHNFGLSNRVEQKQLSIPEPYQHERYNDNIDIRLYSVLGEGEERFNAKFVPLDLWVKKSQIEAVDFIKIDVEGYEYLVLEGAKKTLKSFRPVVMFELNDMTLTLSNRSKKEYIYLAKDNGYEIFGLEYGWKNELLPIQSEDQIKLVSDLILLPSL